MKPAIHIAIADVLRERGQPMTPDDIYQAILKRNLYSFKAQDPRHVVISQLRRHCKELHFPSSRKIKYFSMTGDGLFQLLDEPIRVPPSLYEMKSKAGGKEVKTLVSIPTDDQDTGDESSTGANAPSHCEIQWRILNLGSEMNLSVWAPMGDRGKSWNGKRLGEVPNLLTALPVRFDSLVAKTVENIDVLWFNKKAIIAGFEVEHTSSIYSGLLRMSDLLTMQPNLEIKMYLVAPDERLAKFAREVARPTFSSLSKPLYSICRFLPYTSLLGRLEQVKHVLHHLKPEFLDDITEVCNPREELDES
jgi:hypothetical protein